MPSSPPACPARSALDERVGLTLALLTRGQPAAFVAAASGFPLLFVTQVEAGAAIVRREQALRRQLLQGAVHTAVARTA